MRKGFWLALMLAAAGLGGCASDDDYISRLPPEPGRNVVEENRSRPVECVPYARAHSGIRIYGDAWTWWDKAAGRFARASTPAPGAVMVLDGYAGPERAHLAVVRRVVSAREIRVDHANWLDHGSVYLDDPVTDVSTDNDWSAVRVWNIRTGAWGARTYPVKGFILPGAAANARVAMAGAPQENQ